MNHKRGEWLKEWLVIEAERERPKRSSKEYRIVFSIGQQDWTDSHWSIACDLGLAVRKLRLIT